MGPKRKFALTERQKHIIRRLSTGLKRNTLAVEMGISRHTLDNYLGLIFQFLGVGCIAAAVRIVIEMDQKPVTVPFSPDQHKTTSVQ